MQKNLGCVFLVIWCLFAVATSSAQIVTFEAPAYTVGAFSTEAPANSSTTAVGPTGQGQWSRSTSTDGGLIQATTSSGSYVGGQAFGTVSAVGGTYNGAKLLNVPYTFNGLTFQTSYSFDLRAGTADTVVGTFLDNNGDGLYTQTEGRIGAGFVNSATAGVTNFGLYLGSRGTRLATTTVPTPGNWYHFTVTLQNIRLGSSTNVTVTVQDLTTNTPVNFGTSNSSYGYTLDSGEIGYANGFPGFYMLSSNNGLIDNIAVPEPAACVCLAVAGGCLGLARRRRR